MPDSAMPVVTIVVPCLNRAVYLRATIDSVLAQDYPAIECIVMDGGSSDASLAILESYGGRICWRSEPDRGPFEAITKGWALGTGEFLGWLNADDVLEPGAIAACVEAFRANPAADVVYGGAIGLDERGRERYRFPARPFRLQAAILHCDHVIMQAASLVRRRAVDAAGGLYPSWAHDHELWLRIGLNGGAFQPLAGHFARIRLSNDDAHADPARMVPVRLSMTRRIFASPLLPARLRGREREALSNVYVRAFDLLQLRHPRHWYWGVRCLVGAVAVCPRNTPHVLHEVAVRVRQRLRNGGA